MPPGKSIIDTYLEDQQRLQTPVALYAGEHARGDTPALEPVYRDLIPLSAPGPGEQYAFEVELDSCTGCKACVSACHSLNGLDDNEAWRDVGLIIGGSQAAPFQQTVTTACHHCADPACLNGCPVLAYEKDPQTGIVRHLDDQCIGCQYCVMMCPYDVPKYNGRLGIVRKCDMCHQRLAVGEAPACVQACPTQAIRIVNVQVHRSHPPRLDTSAFLPCAPDPAITQPATRYLSERRQPENVHAADDATLRPQPPHWPIAVMLTLVSAAVGVQTVLLSPLSGLTPSMVRWFPAGAGAAGLVAAGFHLGRPLRAWRVFLGLRRSWFSRETVLLAGWMALTFLSLRFGALAWPAAGIGGLGLFCSVMIYVSTRRKFWRLDRTGPRIFGSAIVVALALARPDLGFLALSAKLAFEALSLIGSSGPARLQRGPLRSVVALRFGLGGLALGLLFACPPRVAGGAVGQLISAGAFLLVLAGELAERHLFFRAVDSPKMPGMPAEGPA